MQKLAVGLKEAAELASVGETEIREWCARGLPHKRTKGGGKIIIRVQDLDDWIAQQARTTFG